MQHFAEAASVEFLQFTTDTADEPFAGLLVEERDVEPLRPQQRRTRFSPLGDDRDARERIAVADDECPAAILAQRADAADLAAFVVVEPRRHQRLEFREPFATRCVQRLRRAVGGHRAPHLHRLLVEGAPGVVRCLAQNLEREIARRIVIVAQLGDQRGVVVLEIEDALRIGEDVEQFQFLAESRRRRGRGRREHESEGLDIRRTGALVRQVESRGCRDSLGMG